MSETWGFSETLRWSAHTNVFTGLALDSGPAEILEHMVKSANVAAGCHVQIAATDTEVLAIMPYVGTLRLPDTGTGDSLVDALRSLADNIERNEHNWRFDDPSVVVGASRS